jgi:hypothetical protein
LSKSAQTTENKRRERPKIAQESKRVRKPQETRDLGLVTGELCKNAGGNSVVVAKLGGNADMLVNKRVEFLATRKLKKGKGV